MQRSSVGPSRRRWIATLDTNILPLASQVKDRKRSAQRDMPLKLEIAFCVHGVINTFLGNLKRSLGGTYHAFDFAKYAHRYLAEACFAPPACQLQPRLTSFVRLRLVANQENQ